MQIVIIEDELLTAQDLASTLKKVEPDVEIVAVLDSVQEAVAFFSEPSRRFDLIFSDIQLGDGLSFEIFQQLQVQAPIIFCTAYDEYALKAFKVHSIHYMLKPFNVQSVGEALAKFHSLRSSLAQSAVSYENLLQILKPRPGPRSVLVYYQDKIMPVKLEAVALFYIEHETTFLTTFENMTYPISKTLDELDQMSGPDFYRANRQVLVNRRAIKDTVQYFGRKLALNLVIPFEEKITVSKTKVSEFLEWLSQ